jgi:nucleoid-associated protein YgaU
MEEESGFIRGEAERRKKVSAPTTNPTQVPTTTPVVKETVPQTPPVSDNEYTIQSGETLWKLTKGDPAKIKQIQTANPGLDPNKLSVGQKIKIPR